MQTHAHRAASQECSYFPSKLPSVEGAGRICNTDGKCQAALLHCHWNKCYRTVLDSRSTQLLMRKKSNELNSVVSIPVFMSLFLFFGSKCTRGFSLRERLTCNLLNSVFHLSVTVFLWLLFKMCCQAESVCLLLAKFRARRRKDAPDSYRSYTPGTIGYFYASVPVTAQLKT